MNIQNSNAIHFNVTFVYFLSNSSEPIRYRDQNLIIHAFHKLDDTMKEKIASLNPYSLPGMPVLFPLRHKK